MKFIKYILVFIIILIIIIIICAQKWVNRINRKNIFIGDGDNWFENLLQNCINGMILFFIPKENDRAFLDWEKMYPELKILEENWEIIRDEAERIEESAPEYGNVDEKNKGLSFSDKKYWKVYVLKYYKDFINDTCKNVENTCMFLKKIENINLAMFSILEKGKVLYPHRGPYKGILRVHLPLKIPKHNKTYIKVNDIKHYWQEGKLVAFDDTFIHSVKNPDNIDLADDRTILFMDLPRRDIPSIFNVITKLVGKYFNQVNKKVEKNASDIIDNFKQKM